ncbi:MAG: hypothetical protein L0H12_06050, partial [Nitrosospira sp.]|nr:hypothetical protein [Nitrosospira sp.]
MDSSDPHVKASRRMGASLAFPASVMVLIIMLAPILMLFRYSFNSFEASLMVEGFSLHNYRAFITDPYYRDVFLDTIYVAASC